MIARPVCMNTRLSSTDPAKLLPSYIISSFHRRQVVLLTQEGATFQQQQKQHTRSHTTWPCNTPSLIHRPKPITTTSSPKAQCRSPKPHADCHGQHSRQQRCALPTGPTSGLHPTLTHTFSRETNKQSSQHKISRQLYITRPSPQGATSAPTPLNFC